MGPGPVGLLDLFTKANKRFMIKKVKSPIIIQASALFYSGKIR